MKRRVNKYVQKRKLQTGAVVSPLGQWKYPGQVTIIPDSNITMKGVQYPVLGVSDTGDVKMMFPDNDYKFDGNEVTEYPIKNQNAKSSMKLNVIQTPFIFKSASSPYAYNFNLDPNKKIDFSKWNVIEQRGKTFQKNNWTKNMYDLLYKKLIYDNDIKISINDIAELIGDESSYDKFAKNGSFVGPFQMDKNWFVKLYGDDGNDIYDKYISKTREDNDIVEDIYKYIKLMSDRIPNDEYGHTYGRFKINQYAPNASFDSKINNTTWDYNVSKEIENGLIDGNNLKQKDLTYRKLAEIYDNTVKKRRLEREYGKKQSGGYTSFYDLMNSSDNNFYIDSDKAQKGGIHINPKNKGKFTAAAQRAGKSVQEYARQILANKENYTPTLIKRANFARNASKFKHQAGGDKPSFEEYYQSLPAYKNDTMNYDLRTAYQYFPYEEMKQFATMPNKHLSSVVELPDGSYRFLKSKNHPSLQKEIDWYNSDDTKEFRNNYILDTSGEYYRYMPKKHQIGKYLEGNYIQPQTVGNIMNEYNNNLAEGMSKGDMVANAVGAGLNAAIDVVGGVLTGYGKTAERYTGVDYAGNKIRLANGDNDGEFKYFNSTAFNYSDPLQEGRKSPWEIYKGKVIGTRGLGLSKTSLGNIINKKENPGWNTSFDKEHFDPWSEDRIYKRIEFEQTGANANNLAQIEQGEVVSTPTGNSIANLLAVYHQLFPNIIEKNGTNVKLTNDMFKDIAKNPTLSPISKRINHYTSARRHGNTFIFPSTVGLNGKILEPKKGIHYPLAEYINNEYLA